MKLLWFLVSLSVISCVSGRVRRSIVFRRQGTNNTSLSLDNLWVDQKLDHFDKNNPGVWKQRYQEVDEYFTDPDGPIFLYIGGEAPLHDWNDDNTLTMYAPQYKALCLGLEHRFYGESQPTGDLSVSSLRYLSSEQALADVSHFVEYMRDRRNLTDNKWVVLGGSYSGNLAAWARLKYPHLIHAAVSISSPVLAQMDFKGYDRVVAESLAASSPRCSENVHKATLAVQNSLKNSSAAAEFYKKFKFCSKLDPENILDVKTFISSIASNVEWIVQYNRIYPIVDVDSLCSIMDNASEELVERFANLTRMLMELGFMKCTEISYHDMIQRLKSTSPDNSYRAWTYQTCTEFGYFQTSSSPNDLFGPLLDLEYSVSHCTDTFGKDFDSKRVEDGVKRTNVLYGGLDIVHNVTNVVFVHGSLDPWHVLGVYKSSNPKAPAILIEGTAHCAIESEWDDFPPLIDAQKKVDEILGQFLQTHESQI